MIFGQLIVGMQQNALATQRIVFQSKDWGRPHVETLHASVAGAGVSGIFLVPLSLRLGPCRPRRGAGNGAPHI